MDISDAAVDAMIGAEWNEDQGRFLSAMGAAPEDKELAASAWLNNPDIRKNSRKKIHTTLVVLSIARDYKLTEYTKEELREFIKTTLGKSGVKVEDVLKEVDRNPQYAKDMGDNFVWLRTLNFIHDKAAN